MLQLALALFLVMFGAGCVSGPSEHVADKVPAKVIFFPETGVAKKLVLLTISGERMYRGAGIDNINSGENAVALVKNLWNNPPADKAVYIEQIGSRMVVGEDGKEKEVQFTTIFVFSSSPTEKLQGWHVVGELRSGAVPRGSLTYVTRGSRNWFGMVFIQKPDVLMYAWIDKAATDPAITHEEFARMILPYRAFTSSIFEQVRKHRNFEAAK